MEEALITLPVDLSSLPPLVFRRLRVANSLVLRTLFCFVGCPSTSGFWSQFKDLHFFSNKSAQMYVVLVCTANFKIVVPVSEEMSFYAKCAIFKVFNTIECSDIFFVY